jgi:hypothetical protein
MFIFALGSLTKTLIYLNMFDFSYDNGLVSTTFAVGKNFLFPLVLAISRQRPSGACPFLVFSTQRGVGNCAVVAGKGGGRSSTGPWPWLAQGWPQEQPQPVAAVASVVFPDS